MEKDEVLLFKQWDSDRTLSGRLCFHTAFKDPNAPSNIPPRESIEARAIAYFPNHEPDTCPPLVEEPADDNIENEDEVIKNAVKKILVALDFSGAWPYFAKVWIKGEYAKGKAGVRNIAVAMANDASGHFGLKNLNQSTKEKIISELMKQGSFEVRLKINVEKLLTTQKAGSNSTQSKVFCVLIGASLGWVLCKLFNGNILEQEL